MGILPNVKIRLTRTCLAFAKALSRPKSSRKGQVVVTGLTGLALLSLFAATFGGFFAGYTHHTFRYSPDFALPNTMWRVLYANECDHGCKNLWQSKSTLADKSFFHLIAERKGQDFWVGVNLDAIATLNAFNSGGRYLLIGRINAPFRLYVNDRERLSGNGKDILPIILPLGSDDISGNLRIAIRVNHVLGSSYPVAINYPSFDTGLYRQETFGSARDYYLFLGTLMPLALAITGLIFSLIFLFLWLNVRQRNEFFAFSAFAFCLFSIQLLAWINVSGSMHRQKFYETDLYYRILEGTLAAFLGFSYARVRISSYVTMTALAILSLLLIHHAGAAANSFLEASLVAGKIYAPTGFFLGACACFSQSFLGKIIGFDKMTEEKQNERCNRLNQFAILLTFLGAIYAIEAFRLTNFSGFAAYWHRPLQFGLVFLMAGFLLRDYRNFDILSEKSHVSRFHRPSGGPAVAVQGILLEIDMKNSSKYYEDSARLANGKELPSLWTEAAIQIAATRGGEILATEGDAFRAFFDKKFHLSSIYNALEEIEKMSRTITKDLVCFRATCVKGAILPVYKDIGGKLFEDYEHAPGSSCFKDAARFLQQEKKISNGENKSILVIESGLSLETSPLTSMRLMESKELSVPDVGIRELNFYSFN